jgi:hypothetical protein
MDFVRSCYSTNEDSPDFQIVPTSSLVPIYQNHSSKKLSPFHKVLGLSLFIEKMGTIFLRAILISDNQM